MEPVLTLESNGVSVRKPERKKPVGRPGRRWEDNIKTVGRCILDSYG
jgi:hypothetical protein